jgi:hypothetical protein
LEHGCTAALLGRHVEPQSLTVAGVVRFEKGHGGPQAWDGFGPQLNRDAIVFSDAGFDGGFAPERDQLREPDPL